MIQQRAPAERAAELSSEHWSGFPINPWAIAARAGVRVRQSYTLPRYVGVIARPSATSPLIMLVNGNDHRRKQRFTVAHELGHYTKLKEQGGLSCRLGFIEDREDLSILHATQAAEVDANQFAAELLMPASALMVWYHGDTPFETAQHLFDVPPHVLRDRYTSLGLSSSLRRLHSTG